MENIEQRVRKIVAEQLGVNAADIKNDSSFVDDLGADSVSYTHLDVYKRQMQEAVPVGTGAMAAIMNLDDDRIQEACAEAADEVGNGEVVERVNFNAPGQTVIAGSKAAVERACEGCKARGAKRALLLPVSAPFHSSLIRPAAVKLGARLAELNFAEPKIQVVNNVDVAIESDPARIKDALIRQAFSPVRWVETIQKIASIGITTVAECGPGKVLAGLTKRCSGGLNGLALADLAAIEAAIPSME